MRKTFRLYRRSCGCFLLLAAAFGLPVAALIGAQPAGVPVSKFAPVTDLLHQVDFFIGRTADSLADPLDFDEAKQSRALKDANTLSALGLLLAMHDQDFPEKPGMPALIASAQALAEAQADAQRAKQALAGLQAARAGKPADAPAAEWKKVASLKALMKQVPLVHTGLKRGVEPSRLARQKVQSAGQAATLAAIAQASALDTEWLKSPEEIAQWTKYCVQMRDAAGEVNAGVQALDQARVAAAMKQMTQSCDDCHAQFRHE